MRLFVDEDLPRSLVTDLIEDGFEATDVRSAGLKGKPDEDLVEFAKKTDAVLLTGDIGIGNVLRFPLGSHSGIALVRWPEGLPIESLKRMIRAGLKGLTDEEVMGNLVVIEPGKLRVKRPPQ